MAKCVFARACARTHARRRFFEDSRTRKKIAHPIYVFISNEIVTLSQYCYILVYLKNAVHASVPKRIFSCGRVGFCSTLFLLFISAKEIWMESVVEKGQTSPQG